MGYYPQESLYKPYKYHGYTVRGTPNCPLKLTASSPLKMDGLEDFLVSNKDGNFFSGRASCGGAVFSANKSSIRFRRFR